MHEMIVTVDDKRKGVDVASLPPTACFRDVSGSVWMILGKDFSSVIIAPDHHLIHCVCLKEVGNDLKGSYGRFDKGTKVTLLNARLSVSEV